MGCCSSADVKSPTAKMALEMLPTASSEGKCSEVATPEKIKIELEIKIPKQLSPSQEILLSTAENSDDSGKSISPTGVGERSRRKSVTFNPISTVKEYQRNSSTCDNDYIEYFCEQLGFDTLSDTDSTDGIEDPDENEQEHEKYSGNHSPTFLPSPSSADDDDWLRYEAELLRESEIDPSDPRYIHDYDIEYEPSFVMRSNRVNRELVWCS